MRFVVDEMAVRQVFLTVLWFFSCQYHATISPYSLSMCCSYQKDKWEKPGNLQTKHCSFWYQETIEQKSNFVVEIKQFSLLW